jgi:Lrp/AsnC family transcriptional regulator for asnA, asnC and gidA|tara:strand:+ start:1645 stop:2139 length:495 start_codon:yes stop_codon:yes gene_type:complete
LEFYLTKYDKLKKDILKLDGIDKKILKMLMENSRRPILEIAKNIGISGAAIHQRLRKLESQNLIIGSSIIVNTKVLGFTTMAFIGIFLDKATSNKTVVNQLKEIPEILECHYTTGDWSVLAKLICKDNEDLMEILTKKIQTIQGVSRTETYISLEQQINRQISL